jgi:membrane-bound lytic murein transglycosylase D
MNLSVKTFAVATTLIGSLLMSLSAQALPMALELFTIAQPKTFPSQIPHEMNPQVNAWVKYFSVRDHERFDRFMGRGAMYKSLIQEILVENGVPSELYYLVWQFIAPTGRRYGLRIDQEVDERMDVIRATRAAARYLKDLKMEFGSWYLAMAAYNCGENRVRRAVARAGTKDFWKLARARRLPAETINYIPKFQAAMVIARNPERFGFRRKTLYDFPSVDKIRVRGRIHLAEVARSRGVSRETILMLNPHLLRSRTPRVASGFYQIYLPSKSL